MQEDQPQNKQKWFCKASRHQRIIALIVLALIVGFFAVAFLAAYRIIDLGLILMPCGFRQRFGLPCPSCFMTTSCVLFAKGRFLDSFYLQPAAAFLCILLLISGFLAFLTAVFRIYFPFVGVLFKASNIKYLILVLLIIFAAGWAVTLSRAFADR